MSEGQKGRQTTSGELWGIVLLTFSVLITIALVSYDWQDIPVLKAPSNYPPANFIGLAGAWLSFVALMTFGVSAFLLPVGTVLIGIIFLLKPKQALWPRILWAVVAILAVSALAKLHPAGLNTLCSKFNISDLSGGLFGWLVAGLWFGRLMGNTGATILFIGLLVASLFMFIGRQTVRAFSFRSAEFFFSSNPELERHLILGVINLRELPEKNDLLQDNELLLKRPLRKKNALPSWPNKQLRLLQKNK